MHHIKRIGVFTSGGDAPGMNAAVRAVVRAGVFNNLEVFGIYSGYKGMIEGEFKKMEAHDVSGIIHRGGTILKTARSNEFRSKEGREKAYENLKKHNIDAVVAIGGDGTFAGANIFSQEHNIPFVGIPGTIDNDIFGTDYTIGFDTAINTVVEAVDKIRDTAFSHDRLFFIEVMGREAGFVALNSGIACGAEGILIPEIKNQVQKVKQFLSEKGDIRKSSIFLVAEGDEEGRAMDIADNMKNEFPRFDIRVTILGHIQRGGSPTCYDRVSASRMGVAAVEALLDNKKSIMIGLVHDDITCVPLNQTVKMHKDVSKEFVHLSNVLV
jgi:6-phosphofructokinase 1